MNRKDFLATAIPLVAATAAFGKVPQNKANPIGIKIPPYLKKGDLIGICCASGFISIEDCEPAVNKMIEWGFNVRLGDTVGAKDFTYGGTDEERLRDFQKMIDDPLVKAVMLGRGGYGAVRIIDKIDFSRFIQRPKWIIGFSDVTVFHLHLNRKLSIASIHSKMCNSFPTDFSKADDIQIKTIESIKNALVGERMNYNAPFNSSNRLGMATGTLIGGNLSLIYNLCGSQSDVETDGKILFIEDVGEYLYKLDGMLWNLKRSGKLSKLAGLVVGGFRIKADDAGDAFGSTLEQMVLEKVKDYKYPVCFDFPVGHIKENYALKCGVKHVFKVESSGTNLSEV